jgi:cell division protein FtsB
VVEYQPLAEVAEQADALRSGRSGLYAHVGSTPTFGTSPDPDGSGFFCLSSKSRIPRDAALATPSGRGLTFLAKCGTLLAEASMTYGKVRNSLPIVRILLVLMGVLAIYLLANFVRQVAISQQRRSELSELEQAIADAQEERAELEEALTYAQSDAAVDEWARKIGWARPDEVSVVVIAPAASTSPGEEGSPEGGGGPALPRDAWWDLFFGTR